MADIGEPKRQIETPEPVPEKRPEPVKTPEKEPIKTPEKEPTPA